ncbi:MAG: branched-chain amino acid transaminase [Chloroflexi bacterium]|nr:branched-chain amino acid transaminase [Chloroflexota bacterium]
MLAGYAFLEGKYMPVDEAKVNVMTHALQYGTGIFEGIRGNWNEEKKELYLFRMREHYERLINGSKLLKISLPYTVDELCKMTVELVKQGKFKEDIYIRPLAYKSSTAFGVRLHNLQDDIMIIAVPWGSYFDAETIKCCVSSWRRPDNNVIPPQVKATGVYLNNALCKTEAQNNGFDEGIMLAADGKVSEGSGENIFIVKNNKLITPSGASSILLGITRDAVKRIAKEQFGYDTEERLIDRYELYVADEAFFTGTAAHVTPIGSIDHRPLGNGDVGPVTQKIKDYYFGLIKGKRSEYPQWLTPIYHP